MVNEQRGQAMSEYEECDFQIKAYSPETIPMVRLAQYMLQFGKLLGNDNLVHFEKVKSGSTVLVSRVEHEATQKVKNRIDGLHNGQALDDVSNAFAMINDMLRDDNAVGFVKWKAVSDEKAVSAEILKFPGVELPRPQRLGPFSETTVIDAELVRIGGRDQSAHAQFQDAEGRTWSGELTRQLAQKIAPYLYKGPILRITGEAKWFRTENGAWELKTFRIKDFDTLLEESLEQTMAHLRRIEGSEWGGVENLDDYIKEQRRDGDGIH